MNLAEITRFYFEQRSVTPAPLGWRRQTLPWLKCATAGA